MELTESGRLLSARYRLSTVIGRGGMGVVWQARDELLNRDVAVKQILWPPHFTEAEQQIACRRATREAQMAARLSHRNVIRIYDIVEADGCPWIIMELLPYRSLRDLIRDDGPLTPADAAQAGLGILAALRAAHEEGILHRDVKPANVLIGPDGRVVLTDFGVARATDSPTLTTAGALIGSPSYIAPERAMGEHSGKPADLWGLGATLYAAVEGRPPYERDGMLPTLTAVVADEPDPAYHLGPLEPVISGLLRKNPAERLKAPEAERMLRRAAFPTLPQPRLPGTPAPAELPDSAAAPEAAAPETALPQPVPAAEAVAAPESAATPGPTTAEPESAAAPEPSTPEAEPAPTPASAAEARLTAPAEVNETAAPPESPSATIPDLELAATPEPEPDASPEPEPVAIPEPEATASPEPEPVAIAEPEAAATPEPEPAAIPEPQPAAAPDPAAVAVPAALASEGPGTSTAPRRPRDSQRPPSSRRRGPLVGAVVLIAVAAAVTAIALALTAAPHRATASPGTPGQSTPGQSPRPTSSGDTSAPASHATTPGASSGTTPPTGSSASSSSSANTGNNGSNGATGNSGSSGNSGSTGNGSSAGYGALPSGFYRFTNSTGFSIGVPQGWVIQHVGHYVYVRDPSDGNVFLLIDQSDQPKPDPLADWEQQAANRAGTYPDYHQIRLQSVQYPQAEKAADWEFTFVRNGLLVHILNRNILANASHAYALYWSVPQSEWTADYHYFQAFASTFRPAAA